MNAQLTTPRPQPDDEDGGFDALRAAVAKTLKANEGQQLFVSSATNLHSIFLDNLPQHLRQHYTCNCCRSFINHYGGLVFIDENGRTRSAIWPAWETVPVAFQASIRAMVSLFDDAKVDGVFMTAEAILGTPTTGPWTHFHLNVPVSMRARDVILTPGQLAAQKREDRGSLIRGLTEFTDATLTTAHTLLTSGQLYRSDKAVEIVEWLISLKKRLAKARRADSPVADAVVGNVRQNNLLWQAAASAPAGWCHVRSGMVGTLLEDITNGYQPSQIKQRWDEKMSPANYQRATAAPAAGNIAQAEKIITQMKAAGSLGRRFAELADIPGRFCLWCPPARQHNTAAAAEGVFAHIVPKAKKVTAPPTPTALPEQTMTWAKFQSKVLPTATKIEVQVPASADRFMALVTAESPEAPPILQWDSEEARNTFSWYYHAGIDAEIKRRVTSAGGQHEGVDIRASLLWNNRNDLDIHCVGPQGEVYYGNKRIADGWLDVDMNIGGETEKPVENIRWPRGRAPRGNYRFFVHNYTERTSSPTPIRVELELFGNVMHFDGVMPWGRGNVVEIAEFSYTGIGTGLIWGKPRSDAAAVLRHQAGVLRPASTEGAWGVRPGQYVPVTAIVPSPNMWGKSANGVAASKDDSYPMQRHGNHVFFLLEGCKDSTEGEGRGFFVETLRSDFHPIRSTLEAYAATAPISGADKANAAGLGFNDQAPWNLRVRVTTQDSVATYLIDRWD